MRRWRIAAGGGIFVLAVVAGLLAFANPMSMTGQGSGWKKHVLFSGPCCTDGVRFADMDGDGRTDIATSIEESGEAVLLFNDSGGAWTPVELGENVIKRPEDTLPIDLDKDGNVDLLVSQENRSQRHTACFNPGPKSAREATQWSCQIVPATQSQKSWMIAEPITLADGQEGFVIGGKESENRGLGSVALLMPGRSVRDLSSWTYRTVEDKANRVMAITLKDFNDDGRQDIAFVDRRGPQAGLNLLEQPASGDQPWRHRVISQASQAMYGTLHDGIFYSLEYAQRWEIVGYDITAGIAKSRLSLPEDMCEPRSFVIADLVGDAGEEFAVFCAQTTNHWVRAYVVSTGADGKLDMVPVAYSPGNWFSSTKYDAVFAADMDQDGDLDLISDEETYGGNGEGVVWYENPRR